MTIIARLNTLTEAYAGVAALRACAIPSGIVRDGEHVVITVDHDFADRAKNSLVYTELTNEEAGQANISSSLVYEPIAHENRTNWLNIESQNT